MSININNLLAIITVTFLWSCAANKPYINRSSLSAVDKTFIPDENIDYELFLVGDIGAEQSSVYNSDIVDLIKSELKPNSKKQSVVFLGNTFSETGIPDEESPAFKKLDKSIEDCIRKLKDDTDKIYFIPGNTEWYDGHHHTVSSVNNVEHYIESKVKGKNIFVPSNGCGEPKIVKLTDDLLLLLIDSQWVLQGDRSNERKRNGCDVDDEIELVTYIQNILARNKNKNVVIAAHHPVYSNGSTGGNYSVAHHLLPLPVLGSLITSVKKLNGGPQKIGHPQYEAYRSVINTALSNFEGVTHISAHDKNMQYHHQSDNHFVVAGSGSDVDFVRKSGTADFAFMQQGFAKIVHTKDLELWIDFFVRDPQNPNTAKSVFRKRIYKKELINFDDKSEYPDLNQYPKTKKVVASNTYSKGKLGMGNTYREEWGTEVEVPVLLLDEVYGGLKPIQQGGGFQTKSLRLENPEGRQWVIRTIDKDATKVVPHALRSTYFQDLVQDGMSAVHPYGAFAIPVLADAAKIYHANPKPVWLPKQKALGDYNLTMAERVFLFEERPGGKMKDHSDYGGAAKSVNTPDLIEKLLNNHKHKVDQEYVLRARLFDLLVGDWDRHGDQWRWGIYEDENYPDKKIYRSIPRDRDQVFFKNDGIFNYIASRPYFTPSLRMFKDEIDNVSGLSFNARHFDRHFLAELNEEEFINIAKDLQNRITNEVIDEAFSNWSKEIYDISGEDIKIKLKKRRKNLTKTAKEFYRYLTKEVTVIGTYGKNVFDITALPNDQLQVEAYHVEKENKNLIWSRTISGQDCNELRLFGLKKADVFNFSGSEKSSIKIRLVGGSGDDIVNNSSDYLDIIAYDRPDGMTLNGKDVSSKLKDEKGINNFDRKDWKINKSLHFPMISFYTDEGIGINYNIWWQRNGFRKNPYKSNHTLNLGYFWANSALVGKYAGHWTSVFGPDWDFMLDASFTGPTFSHFFYGLGNNYVNYKELLSEEPEAGSSTFHIVRGTNIDVNPHILRDLGNNKHLSINPSFEYINLNATPLEGNESRFIFLNEADRTPKDFEQKLYTGLGLHYAADRVNSPELPTRGYVFKAGADYRQSLSDSEFSNLTMSTNLTAYIPFSPSRKVVLATNLGGAYTFGDYEFFHANYLASHSQLRGYKTNRFAGDGMVYHATDLRVKLLQGRGKLNLGVGLFGSFDYGRAFLEGEGSNDWHTSYGGGIYLTPLNMVGFKIGYYVGEDDTQLSIGGTLSF